jgi:hypothetical protein
VLIHRNIKIIKQKGKEKKILLASKPGAHIDP